MAENPKIVFEGKDNITPAAQSATQSIKDLAKTLLEKSLAESTTSKGALLNYEKEIFLLKQKKQLEIESKRETIGASYERKIKEIRSDKEEAERIAKDKSIPREERISAITSLRTRAFEKREEGTELDYKKQLKALEDETKENQKQTKILMDTFRQIQLLSRILAQGEAKPEKYKELLEELGATGHGGEEFSARVKQEQGVGGIEKDRGGIFSGVFLGNLAADVFKEARSAFSSSTRGAVGLLTGEGGGPEMAAQVFKYMPNLLGIPEVLGEFMGKHYQEKAKEESAGAQWGGISKGAGGGLVRGVNFGMTWEDVAPIQIGLAKARGSLTNIQEETLGALHLTKGLGIDMGEISKSASTYRYQDTKKTVAENVGVMLSVMGIDRSKEGNQRVGELLAIQNRLIEDQAKRREVISPETTATVMASFQQFGGSFRDARMGERITSINQALTSPQGDYQQAMSFATLAQLKPGGSFLDMMKMQEKGIEQEGYMQKMMETLSGQYGTGDLFTIALKNRFNLSAEQAETLATGWREGKGFEEIGKLGKTGQVITETGTSFVETQRAKLEYAYADSVITGIKEAVGQLGTGFTQIGLDILAEIKKLL